MWRSCNCRNCRSTDVVNSQQSINRKWAWVETWNHVSVREGSRTNKHVTVWNWCSVFTSNWIVLEIFPVISLIIYIIASCHLLKSHATLTSVYTGDTWHWLAMSTFRNVHSVSLRLRGTGLRSSVLICCDYNDIVLIYVFNGILGIEPDCLLAHGLLFSIYWRYWSLLQLTPRQFLCTRPLRGFLTNKANNFVVSIGKGLVYSEVKHKCTVIILWTSKSR